MLNNCVVPLHAATISCCKGTRADGPAASRNRSRDGPIRLNSSSLPSTREAAAVAVAAAAEAAAAAAAAVGETRRLDRPQEVPDDCGASCMWEGIKNANMAQYTHVKALQLPQRSCRKLGLIEVAMMVMRIEIKTIEFWRAVISECLGTFLYVLLGCSSMLYCNDGSSILTGRVQAAVDNDMRADSSGIHSAGDHRTDDGRGVNFGGSSDAQAYLIIALSFGLIMATLVQCFGHISGAHFNPVTTVAMALTCKITPLRGFFYAVAQLGGGIAGAALLYG